MKVFISAGHGGNDPGAVGNGHKESDLAVRARNRVVARLTDLGIETLTDGIKQENKPLPSAIEIAKSNKAGISIEIHFNAGPPTARGVEALAYLKDRDLCQKICRAIAAMTQSPLRGDGGYKPTHSGQHHRLAFCEAGGLILEVEFISSAEAMRKYIAVEDRVCNAIADAIADHIRVIEAKKPGAIA